MSLWKAHIWSWLFINQIIRRPDWMPKCMQFASFFRLVSSRFTKTWLVWRFHSIDEVYSSQLCYSILIRYVMHWLISNFSLISQSHDVPLSHRPNGCFQTSFPIRHFQIEWTFSAKRKWMGFSFAFWLRLQFNVSIFPFVGQKVYPPICFHTNVVGRFILLQASKRTIRLRWLNFAVQMHDASWPTKSQPVMTRRVFHFEKCLAFWRNIINDLN